MFNPTKRQSSGAIKSPQKNQKPLVQFGLLLSNIGISADLSKANEWKLHFNTKSMHFPSFSNLHREIVLFFYPSAPLRDHSFSISQCYLSTDFKKVKKYKFKVKGSENFNPIIDDCFEAIRICIEEFDKETQKNAKMLITKISESAAIAYGRSYKLFEKAIKKMNKNAEPAKEHVVQFTILEILLALINKPKVLLNNEYLNEVRFLSQIGRSQLENKINSCNYFMSSLICDLIWEDFFHCDTALGENLSAITSLYSFPHSTPLANDQNYASIVQILKSFKLQKFFSTHTISSIDYLAKINDICQKTFIVYSLPKDTTGFTTFAKYIAVASAKEFSSSHKAFSGYVLLVLLHELGHVFARKNCNSALQNLEYESDSRDFLAFGAANLQKAESGFQVEISLFGKVIKFLTVKAAEFIIEPKNWNKHFIKGFELANAEKRDKNGELVGKRMRKSERAGVYVDKCHMQRRRKSV